MDVKKALLGLALSVNLSSGSVVFAADVEKAERHDEITFPSVVPWAGLEPA